MAYSTGTLRGVGSSDRPASSRRRSRLLARGARVAGFSAALAALVGVPVAAAWMISAALRAHAVIRGGESVGRLSLVRVEPRAMFADAARFPVAPSPADLRRIADLELHTPSRPGVVTTGMVSLPPARPAAAVDVIPLPPVRLVLPSQMQPKDANPRSSPRDGGIRLAATSSSVISPQPRVARNSGEAMLNALKRRVEPALPDPRRDDIVGSISAYNNPDPPRESNRRTAVYDIAAHTVYMPNGDRLEAHSGLGGHFDDPRSVHVKNRGATPPNLYNLVLRERPFHGVAALRLNPVGEGNMFGRDGILAHSYLLGSRGESNGCVSFKDYARFLQAFRRGEVSRIIVVPRLTGSPSSVVARLGGSDRYAANGRNAAR